MAVAVVDIQVDARNAVQQLKQVNQQSRTLQQTTNSTTQALSRQQQALSGSRAALSGLAGAVSKLAAAYVGLRTAQQAVQASIQREESSRRLQFLAKGYNEIAASQEAAARAGKLFGLSATESNQQFAQLYGRLRPLNVSLSDIESAFIGFNTAAKVSGATAAESAGALLQLTQALGSGVLRGQELNSVLEQAPGLVVALTQELDAPISQIRKLAEDGKITSEVVIRALKRAGSEGADQLAAAMQGPAQQVKNLQNAFEDLQVAATEDLMPAITASIIGLRDVLVSLGPVVRGIGSIAASTIGTLADLISMATKPQAFAAKTSIRAGRLPLGTGGAAELFKGTSGAGGVGLTGIINEARELSTLRRQPFNQVLLQLMQNRLTRMDTPAPVAGGRLPSTMPRLGADTAISGGGGRARGAGANDAQRAAEAAAKEAERVAEVIRLRTAEGQIIGINSELKDKIAAAEIAGDKMLVTRLQGQQREIDLQYKYAQELAKETDLNAQKAIIFEAQNALVANQADTQRELNELQNDSAKDQIKALEELIGKTIELTDQQKQQKELAEGIAGVIGQGMTSAFDAIIQGSEDFGTSLRRIASGVLIDIANQLLQIFVIQKAINAISGLFGGGGGGGLIPTSYAGVQVNPLTIAGLPSFRANGGSVRAGQPYLVGERGPELFMPGRSGGIAPSGSFGGGVNVVVNVDASGSQVQGDEAQAKALGGAISAAVQAEIVKQQRPGGLLAGTR